MKSIFTILLILTIKNSLYAQAVYRFDSTARIYGCSNFLLQKISKDSQYELLISIIQIDSLPKQKEFDLTSYSKFVTVYLNIYPKSNNYVHEICNDALYMFKKALKPNIYLPKQATILINRWDNKEFIISLVLKNAVFIDQQGKQIKLESEQFREINIGLIPG